MKIRYALNKLKKHGFDVSLEGELAPSLLTGNMMFWGKVVGIKNNQIVSHSVVVPLSAYNLDREVFEKLDILRENGWRLRHENDKDMIQADYFAGISGLNLGKAISLVG